MDFDVRSWCQRVLILLSLVISPCGFAFEDPTGGVPFFPWLWESQLKPTIAHSVRRDNLEILTAGTLATILSAQYDDDVYAHNARGERLLMTGDTAGLFGVAGSGVLGIGIALAQLQFDPLNGLAHARAIALTAASHVTLAFAIGRHRPGGREDYLPFASSFPSGHASSAFATATSLAYAYGPMVGVPSFFIATAISTARVSENTHWLSDVVAGATLGLFWARASYQSSRSPSLVVWRPIPYEDGGLIQVSMEY